MSVREGGIVSIRWNFDEGELNDAQFQVPSDIADNNLPFDVSAKLSDYVDFQGDASGHFWIEVKNPKTGIVIYKLMAFVLDPMFNYIKAIVQLDKTNYKGITGLSDQVRDDLFLKDGTYTLWNRNANSTFENHKHPGKNTYASSPFYMGKSQD